MAGKNVNFQWIQQILDCLKMSDFDEINVIILFKYKIKKRIRRLHNFCQISEF